MSGRAAAAALQAGRAETAPRAAPGALDDGAGLRRYVLGEWKTGVLTARQVCTIAYHSTNAGATGLEDLVMHPTSTHFAEHVTKAIGARAESTFYEVEIPMWDKVQEMRVMRPFHVNLPHDVMAREAELHPDEWDPTKHNEADFPSTLQTHPVRMTHGPAKTVPLGYDSDGVPYAKKDSFLAHYLSNHLSDKRHLLCTLKNQTCVNAVVQASAHGEPCSECWYGA